MRLSTAVRRFVSYKTSQGLQYRCIAVFLRAFARDMGNCLISELRPSRISAFLNARRILPYTRVNRYNVLCVFFRYLKQIDQLGRWPMPARPALPNKTYVPYIYSREEIRRIINYEFLDCFGRRILMEPQTFRTIILFLYGTGLSFSEALTLRRDRVDLTTRTIEVSMRDGAKTRTIPIGRDVCELLRQYLASGPRPGPNQTNYVFLARNGEPVNQRSLRRNFRYLSLAAGITRPGEGYSEPRMQDLRYTFAVHRIASWYEAGADLQHLIPALAVYMGRVGIGSTERLLSLTPEHFAHIDSPGCANKRSNSSKEQVYEGAGQYLRPYYRYHSASFAS